MASPSTSSGLHVLLTGANGFVASHILSLLLARNHAVTATVRSKAKAAAILTTHPAWTGKLSFVVVADFTSTAPFDDLFEAAREKPFTHVVHTASPVKFSVTDIRGEMIEPAVKGTTEILKSAHRHGGAQLKRVVLLGSAVAVLNSFEDMTRAGKPYTEDDWNPVTADDAISRKDTVLGYNVSKTAAEAAAWKFMREEKPGFDLAVINPDIITGPMVHPIAGPESVNETNQFAIKNFLDGTYSQMEGVAFPFYHFVDVRDVARSHVDTLTNPSAGGQRIVLVAGELSPQLVANIIRKNFPALRDRVPEGEPAQVFPRGVHPTGWDLRRSLEILARGTEGGVWEYIGLEKSVTDTVRNMMEVKVI